MFVLPILVYYDAWKLIYETASGFLNMFCTATCQGIMRQTNTKEVT